ncbi:hypothetical protein PHYNN_77 [Pantoea phage Phynn]|nr:hypothetical protein PHYNN_77 [Pantoea phage Phynn]
MNTKMMKSGSMIDTAIQQWKQHVSDAEGGIAYCDQALASDLEPWERKEYEKVKAKHVAELPALRNHLEYLLTL